MTSFAADDVFPRGWVIPHLPDGAWGKQAMTSMGVDSMGAVGGMWVTLWLIDETSEGWVGAGRRGKPVGKPVRVGRQQGEGKAYWHKARNTPSHLLPLTGCSRLTSDNNMTIVNPRQQISGVF